MDHKIFNGQNTQKRSLRQHFTLFLPLVTWAITFLCFLPPFSLESFTALVFWLNSYVIFVRILFFVVTVLIPDMFISNK